MVDTQRVVEERDRTIVLARDETATGRYVITSSTFDFAHFRERRELDLGPGHALDALAKCLDAEIRQPDETRVRWFDHVAARIIGNAAHWALARELVADLSSNDLVYAAGDDCGLPIGLLAAIRRRKIKLAIFYSAPARVRPRTLTRLVAKLGIDLLPVAGFDDKVEYLDSLGLERPALLAAEQTDTGYFHPPAEADGDASARLITSCGLEQRDYATLSEAVESLDVDVKICAVSPNYTSSTVVAMPDVLPGKIEMRHFEFSELRELYQRAAVTVVPLLANHYSAGMTTMMEAIACGSPVIITANPGLASDFAARGLVVGVEPGDHRGLRRAIEDVLDDPERARSRAERARTHVLAHHASDGYVERLCGSLASFHRS